MDRKHLQEDCRTVKGAEEMNGEELRKEFFSFCDKQESCKKCQYAIAECKLLFAYERGLIDANKELEKLSKIKDILRG